MSSCISHLIYLLLPYSVHIFKILERKELHRNGDSRNILSRAEERRQQPMGCRLMAGQRILVPSMGVRLPPSQPVAVLLMLTARSSSGSGRRPLKAEITGSNPVRATMSSRDTRTSLTYLARSSSGSGRRPLKAEITSSNLVRATNCLIPGLRPGIFIYRCSATGTLPPSCRVREVAAHSIGYRAARP